MQYLNVDIEELKEKGGFFTASEISGQPALWKKTTSLIRDKRKEIKHFLNDALSNAKKIVLTGAGTSAYIGLSLQGTFSRNLHVCVDSVPTTDLITHPEDYFTKEESVLLISFARSGDSPESVAALLVAERFSRKCYHLIVTCNPNGALVEFDTSSSVLRLILPAGSNDQGLAMTGSYSSMLLAGFLIARLKDQRTLFPQIERICNYGDRVLRVYTDKLHYLAKQNFNRAVFIGSGPLFGTATESHLKLQELTDGQIICKNETFMGFRHGPKAVIDNETLVFYIFSNNPLVNKYEKDLVESIRKGKMPLAQVGICESGELLADCRCDLMIEFSVDRLHVDEELLAVCSILPAQIISFFKSLELGLHPDNPSVSGAISRVVECVNIYDI